MTGGSKARRVPRAETVGSLMRSVAIRERVEQIYSGMTTGVRALVLPDKAKDIGKLNCQLDLAISEMVRQQIDAGLDVVTDGEIRRSTFLSSFYDALGRDCLRAPQSRFETYDDNGNLISSFFADPIVTKRLYKSSCPVAEEVTYMRSITDHPFKVTLPAPSYFYTDFIEFEDVGYKSRHEFVADAVDIEKQIIAEVIAAGAQWIQFDFPVYPQLVDESQSEKLLQMLGESPKSMLDKALETDSEVVSMIPDDITVALHLCRGNVPGGFWSGSIDSIADRMFNELPHGRFLFEWEDVAREGTYEPIKYLPKGKIMSMGLISTKTSTMENEDEVIERMEAASKYLDIEQLALCTQCGFETTQGSSLVEAEKVQWDKIKLIGSVANRVWGGN